MIFRVVVVGPMPDQFYLGGLLWQRYCVLQWHRNFFRVRNFIFAMLQLEIAPDNAATDDFSLEYMQLVRKVESAFVALKDISLKI